MSVGTLYYIVYELILSVLLITNWNMLESLKGLLLLNVIFPKGLYPLVISVCSEAGPGPATLSRADSPETPPAARMRKDGGFNS